MALHEIAAAAGVALEDRFGDLELRLRGLGLRVLALQVGLRLRGNRRQRNEQANRESKYPSHDRLHRGSRS